MSATVWVEDLTDDQLAEIETARRAAAPPVTEFQLLVARFLAAGPPTRRKPKPRPEPETRFCTRCGIDTTAPDLCRDCEEVGW